MLHTAIDRARRVRRSGQAGFTLIELLIVIVILGVLAGIVVFSVSGITDRGTKAACQADVSTVTTAVEAYYAQNGSYPKADGDLEGSFLHGTMPKDVTMDYTKTPTSVAGKGC
ncbi:MAG: type II secretion system protein [Marmoricola sp.]